MKSILKFLQEKSLFLSQFGQDFWVISEVYNEKHYGFFLDVGAHNGIHLSNTYLLESKYNWKGICIEANPDTFSQLEKNRNSVCLNQCVDSEEGFVLFKKNDVFGGIVSPNDSIKVTYDNNVVRIQTKTLMQILEESNAPNEIDYISMDIEGAEERVLLEFDFGYYMVNCITIERPSIKLREYLKESGFRLIKEIPGYDCFYVHERFMKNYIENVFDYFGGKRYITSCWRGCNRKKQPLLYMLDIIYSGCRYILGV